VCGPGRCYILSLHAYGKGAGRTTKDVDRCLVRELQDLGPSPSLSDTFFYKVKGTSDQIVIRAIRRGMADSAVG